MAQGMRHGRVSEPPRGTGKDEANEGAAWMAGKADWPMFDEPSKPKHPFACE